MCMSSPKIDPPAPAPPPPPPPPPPTQEQVAPVQAASADPTRVDAKKVKGRDALRIDLATSAPSGSTGLNIPA